MLLTEFLDDILNSQTNILQPDSDLHLNVEKIKETPFEELPKEDRITLVLVLLKQLQPYFSSNNLNVAPPSFAPIKGAAAKNMMRASGSQPMRSSRNNNRPKLKTVVGNGSVPHDTEGINRILDNINV